MNKDIKPICLNSKGGRNGVEGLQPSLNDRVYDSNGIATACTTAPFFMPYYTEETNQMNNEPFIVASRGRNPENPSDRTVGAPTEQRLEPNSQGICNTLTTVLKDNYVAEPQKIGNIYPSGGQNGNVYDTNGISPTLLSGETSTKGNGGIGSSNAPKIVTEPQIIRVGQINTSQDGVVVSSGGISPTHTAGHGNMPKVEHNLRIRKLTPKECYRLMGFDDNSFAKAEAVNSNTQLYKQAGNSIVVNVLEYLFINLKPYLYT